MCLFLILINTTVYQSIKIIKLLDVYLIKTMVNSRIFVGKCKIYYLKNFKSYQP